MDEKFDQFCSENSQTRNSIISNNFILESLKEDSKNLKNNSNKNTKTTNNTCNIDEDIYSFIEEIHKTSSKSKGGKFGAKFDFRKENKQGQTDHLSEYHKIKTNQGLSDNHTVDAENKNKAQKGLLLLLNKMSGGLFIPEINVYFTKKKEELKLQKTKDLEEKANEEEKTQILKKQKINRQKNAVNIFKNETFNNIFKEENEENDENMKFGNKNNNNGQNLYQHNNGQKQTRKKSLQQAFNMKEFEEDKESNLYDYLVMFFPKKEAQEITERMKDVEDYNNSRNKQNRDSRKPGNQHHVKSKEKYQARNPKKFS
jgi:hypothetical protein